MSDIELQSEDDGYLNGSHDSEGNEEIHSKVEGNDQESVNSEISEENEDDEMEEGSDEDESDSERGLKRRGGENSIQSKRQAFLGDLVDSEAHEDSSDSEDAENDKSLDEVHFLCIAIIIFSSKRKRRSIVSFTLFGERIPTRKRSKTSKVGLSRTFYLSFPLSLLSDEYIVSRRRKVIEEEPLHPKEPSIDEDLLQKQRELQQAAINEYNEVRTVPTIQDPKIYSVSVRVRLVFFSLR